MNDRQLAKWVDQNAVLLSGKGIDEIIEFLDTHDVVIGIAMGRSGLHKHIIKGAVQLQRIAAEGVADKLSMSAIRVREIEEAVALEEYYYSHLGS